MARSDPRRARRALKARFESFGAISNWTPPRAGWVRAIRDALGMPAASLAERMDISEPAVFALERREREGTVQLGTLRRVAAAMDCTLVYALVPNQDLDASVRERAEHLVDAELRRAEHSMALEDQSAPTSNEAREELIERVANSRGLWSQR